MATAWTKIVKNTSQGVIRSNGFYTKVPERTFPFVYNRTIVDPYYVRAYSWVDPSVWSDLSTTAFFADSSAYHIPIMGCSENQAINLAQFAAFEKFKDKCGDSAQLGASVAESKEAFSMIASRATKIYQAAKYLKRLELKNFAEELTLHDSSSKIRRKVQKFGNDLGATWLEYSYGWKPLIQDIYSAVKVLEGPLKEGVVRGNGTFQKKAKLLNFPTGSQLVSGTISITYRYQYGATVSITNPNLAAASQAGLINPIAPLWELVPFSFVVDWFTPVGNFLENFTFGLGLTFSKKWTAQKKLWIPEGVTLQQKPIDFYKWSPVTDPSLFLKFDRNSDNWGIPSLPRPRLPSFPRDRALNALSLAVTMLSSLQSGLDKPPRRYTA
jgi:hypothetical protein